MTDREAAIRYRWFCTVGWKQPLLNDPLVISGEAQPEDIDALIQDGMRRWPLRQEPKSPPPELPRIA